MLRCGSRAQRRSRGSQARPTGTDFLKALAPAPAQASATDPSARWGGRLGQGATAPCPCEESPECRQEGHHPLDATLVQKAVRRAVLAAGITKPAGGHSFRHSQWLHHAGLRPGISTHQLEIGQDIRSMRALLGHSEVRTTMIYTHVLNRSPRGGPAPPTFCSLMNRVVRTIGNRGHPVCYLPDLTPCMGRLAFGREWL
jgi:hypothetical protein